MNKQETNPTGIFGASITKILSNLRLNEDITSGGDRISDYSQVYPIRPYDESDPEVAVVHGAWAFNEGIENADIAEIANRLIGEIEKALSTLPASIVAGYFPKLAASYWQDGSILYEWIFRNYRIGFNIELEEPNESSWYIATDETLEQITTYGLLSETPLNFIVNWIISYIIGRAFAE